MKERLEKLRKEIGGLMQETLAKGKFDQIESLAPMLTKTSKLYVQIGEIEMETATLERALDEIQNKKTIETNESTLRTFRSQDASRAGGGRAAPSTIRIRIRWRLNHQDKDEEEIFSSVAANSLAKFIGRLISEFGDSTIQRLLQIRVNRGPLVSRSPEKDFGDYKSKHVPGTDLFVLTNNSTSEKVSIIKDICRELKLVPGSITVETEDRFHLFKNMGD